MTGVSIELVVDLRTTETEVLEDLWGGHREVPAYDFSERQDRAVLFGLLDSAPRGSTVVLQVGDREYVGPTTRDLLRQLAGRVRLKVQPSTTAAGRIWWAALTDDAA